MHVAVGGVAVITVVCPAEVKLDSVAVGDFYDARSLDVVSPVVIAITLKG